MVLFDVRITHRGVPKSVLDRVIGAAALAGSPAGRDRRKERLRRWALQLRGEPDRLAVYFAVGVDNAKTYEFARRNMRRQRAQLDKADFPLSEELVVPVPRGGARGRRTVNLGSNPPDSPGLGGCGILDAGADRLRGVVYDDPPSDRASRVLVFEGGRPQRWLSFSRAPSLPEVVEAYRESPVIAARTRRRITRPRCRCRPARSWCAPRASRGAPPLPRAASRRRRRRRGGARGRQCPGHPAHRGRRGDVRALEDTGDDESTNPRRDSRGLVMRRCGRQRARS